MFQYLLSDGFSPPERDALRYSDYAINLVEYQTFGLTGAQRENAPEPGRANSPLYPGWVALVATLDTSLRESLRCALTDPEQPSVCPENFLSLAWAQLFLALIGLVLLWLLARLLFNDGLFALATLVFASLSMVYVEKALEIETENLILPLFALLQIGLLQLLRQETRRWAFLSGTAAALLALTRPEFFYLGLTLGCIGLGLFLALRKLKVLALLLCASLAFLSVLAPWMARNQEQFGSPGLSGGNYGEITLAYRLSLNRMSGEEIAASLIYWLPDFGDELAAAVLPRESYVRLISRHPNSYRATAIREFLEPALEKVAPDEIIGYWIATEVLDHPGKHALVTAVLSWRGLFVAKYWGLIGLMGYLWLLVETLRRGNRTLMYVSLPTLLLVVFHAGMSINIPRYNLPLVSLYALGWAWIFRKLLERYWPHRIAGPMQASA